MFCSVFYQLKGALVIQSGLCALCCRLKVSGDDAQHRRPTSQTAFNSLDWRREEGRREGGGARGLLLWFLGQHEGQKLIRKLEKAVFFMFLLFFLLPRILKHTESVL